MTYDRRLDRLHPGCILFLIDQSGSMNEPVSGETRSKAVALAEALNNLLYEMVIRCIKDESQGPRHYYDVGAIGYGSTVRSSFGGPLAGRDLVSIVDIADNPLRVQEREAVVPGNASDDQGTVPRRHKFPVWIDSVASGRTPMCEALNRAGQILHGWTQQYPESFPPIVINISDGAATDGDPRLWAQRIRNLTTRDGNVLFFNLNISALQGQPLFFPANPAILDNDYARLLFEMSSQLPDYMISLANSHQIPAGIGSRGFVYNADMSAVVRFLQIGTATSQAVL